MPSVDNPWIDKVYVKMRRRRVGTRPLGNGRRRMSKDTAHGLKLFKSDE